MLCSTIYHSSNGSRNSHVPLTRERFQMSFTNRFNKNTIVNLNKATTVCFPSYQ